MMLVILMLIAIALDNFVPLSLMVTVLVIGGFYVPAQRAILAAAILGLVMDVALVRPLGLSSVVLIVMATVLVLAKMQFEWESVLFAIASAVLGEMILAVYLGSGVNVINLLEQGVLVGIVWGVFARMRHKEGVYLKK